MSGERTCDFDVIFLVQEMDVILMQCKPFCRQGLFQLVPVHLRSMVEFRMKNYFYLQFDIWTSHYHRLCPFLFIGIDPFAVGSFPRDLDLKVEISQKMFSSSLVCSSLYRWVGMSSKARLVTKQLYIIQQYWVDQQSSLLYGKSYGIFDGQ